MWPLLGKLTEILQKMSKQPSPGQLVKVRSTKVEENSVQRVLIIDELLVVGHKHQ